MSMLWIDMSTSMQPSAQPMRVVIVGNMDIPEAVLPQSIHLRKMPADLLSILSHIQDLREADVVLIADDGRLFNLPTDRNGKMLVKEKYGYDPDSDTAIDSALNNICSDICAIFTQPSSGKREVWVLLQNEDNEAGAAVIKRLLTPPVSQESPDQAGDSDRHEYYSFDMNSEHFASGIYAKHESMMLGDVRDIISRIGFHPAPGGVPCFGIPGGGSPLAETLGEEGFVVPLTVECQNTQTPLKCMQVGFVGFGGNQPMQLPLRTVWIDLSTTTKSLTDVACDCLRLIVQPSTAQEKAYAELHYRKAKNKVEALFKKRGKDNPLIGESPAMLRLYPHILDAALHPRQHVLVYGETGSGKEMLYDVLQALEEPDKPFIKVQITALEGTSLLSAVYGHAKGAFTGAYSERAGAVETAFGGTLVLDNMHHAPSDFYGSFLRFLEPKQEYQKLGSDEIKWAQCRVIAGFNIRPETLVKEGRFQNEWITRFPIRIDLPPLNERREDIPAIVENFVLRFLSENREHASFPASKLVPPSGMVEEWQKRDWTELNIRGLLREVESYIRSVIRESAISLPRTERGRKPGRDVPDQVIVGLLKQIIEDPSGWTVRRLYDQIDKQAPAKRKRTRTRSALAKLIERIAEVDGIAGTDTAGIDDWKIAAKRALHKLSDYSTLP